MFVKILVCGLLITFCGTVNLFAQPDGCGVGGYIFAYVVNKDPKDLNVRDQPSLKGKVLATVKPAPDPGEPAFIEVTITGYSNGWWKIANASGDDGSQFEGIGWVSAKMAAEIIGSNGQYNNKPANLYAASNSKRKIGTIPSKAEVLITGFTCRLGKSQIQNENRLGSDFKHLRSQERTLFTLIC